MSYHRLTLHTLAARLSRAACGASGILEMRDTLLAEAGGDYAEAIRMARTALAELSE